MLGLGMSATVTPLTTTVLAAAGKQYSGTASGVNNAVSRIAGVLAIAVVGAIALVAFQDTLQQQTAGLSMPIQARQELQWESKKLAETTPPGMLSVVLQQDIRQAVRQSFGETYQLVMMICAVLAGISAVLAFLFIRNSEPIKNADPVHAS